MALLDQDEELLAKLREETAGRSDLELPAIDLSASQAPLGGQQVSPGFGVLEAQQGLPSAAAEAPVPAVADIIKQGIAQQAAQKKPSRLEQLASAIRSGGEAVGEGLGKVGAGIGKVLGGGGGAPAESDGYDRAGHAFYAAMTGQKLPQSFFQKVKGPDKELVGLEKELRRAQIIKALRGEPVKPVSPAADYTSPISVAAQDVAVERLKRADLSPDAFAKAEKLIRMQSADQLKGSTPLGTQLLSDYYRQEGLELGGMRFGQTVENEAYRRKKDYETAVKENNKLGVSQKNPLFLQSIREVNRLTGGALSSPEPFSSETAEKAFSLDAKIDSRLKFLPSLVLKKAQQEWEALTGQGTPPEEAWSIIAKKNPEVEQLQIATAFADNAAVNDFYGGALTPTEVGRANNMLGSAWGQSPAGKIYAMRILAKGLNKKLTVNSKSLKRSAEDAGVLGRYAEDVNDETILTKENFWGNKTSGTKSNKSEDLSAFKSQRPDKPVVEPTPPDAQPVANVPDSQDAQTIEALVARDQAAGIPAKSKFDQAMRPDGPSKTPDVVPQQVPQAGALVRVQLPSGKFKFFKPDQVEGLLKSLPGAKVLP